MNNYAYVTLFGGDQYIYGIITLMYSGKRTNSKYPFYLLVTEDVCQEYREIAEMIGYKLISVEEYEPKFLTERYKDIGTIKDFTLEWYGRTKQDRGWRHAFTKMLCFGLTQFDKVLFIDADVLVMKNLDEVFNYPHMSSVCWYEDSLNSAFMVIEPNDSLFKTIMEFTENYKTLRGVELFDDCWVIRDFYPNWMADKSKRIPNKYFYNLFGCELKHENIVDGTNIYSMHMTGLKKPWETGANYIEEAWGQQEWHLIYWYKLYICVLNNALKDIFVQHPNCNLHYIN